MYNETKKDLARVGILSYDDAVNMLTDTPLPIIERFMIVFYSWRKILLVIGILALVITGIVIFR
jgi:hypothetical protein